jgi:lipid A 3-O-deacylase
LSELEWLANLSYESAATDSFDGILARDAMRNWFCVVLSLAAIVGGPAYAADLAQPAPSVVSPEVSAFPFISEIRGGAFAHAIGSPEDNGRVDLNAELLSVKLFRTNDWTDVLIPQLHLGTTINFVGDTSFVYTGFTWRYDISQTAFFVEGTLGGSLNNGQLQDFHNDRNALGCHALFRESASLGYRFDAHWEIMATLEHSSNANICRENRGLTSAGLRLGYRF